VNPERGAAAADPAGAGAVHDVAVSRTPMTMTAVVLFVAALTGWTVFLSGQGLENADRWVTVAGFFVSTLFAAGSFGLAWSASRAPARRRAAPPGADRVAGSGTAHAAGAGHANTGIETSGGDRPARVTRSGDATATGPGSVANSGIVRGPRP
jgi:hypothetical protein